MGLNVANIVLIPRRLKSPRCYRFCPGPGNSPFFWMVPVPVPEKNGPGKKYRYRYRKNLVPEKSTGPGTGKNWSRKKVPVPVPEKILGTVTLCNRHNRMEITYDQIAGCLNGCVRVSDSVWKMSEHVWQMSRLGRYRINRKHLNKYYGIQILLFLPVASCRPNMTVPVRHCLKGV